MPEPKLINVELYCGDLEPRSIKEFQTWLTEIIAQVPKEFQDKIMIEVTDDDDYDYYRTPQLSIWYDRPETVEEALARANEYEARKKANAGAEIQRAKQILIRHGLL